jgi:hypothetical protein
MHRELGFASSRYPSFELPRHNGHSGLRTFRNGWRVLDTVARDRVAIRRPLRTAVTVS